MRLAPTLGSVEALYRKLERESYRAYHGRSRIHKADHFFNFCVTAHSLRDYFFERKGLVAQKDKAPYNDCWDSDPLLVAVGEIANTTKHFTLRKPSGQLRQVRTKGARTKRSRFVDIYESPAGLVRIPVTAPDVTVTLSDGSRYALYQFTARVLESWRLFLGREGIRIRRQPLRRLVAKGAHLLSLSAIVAGLLSTGACSVERQYTRVQTEDGFGMKAPITHIVRVKVDATSRTVTWMQDLRDARGIEARDVKTYGGESFSSCEIFDDYNWSCSYAFNGEVIEAPMMKDGQLSRFYWVNTHAYKTEYRVLGMTFPPR